MPHDAERIQLLGGPYEPPPVRVGQRLRCVLNGPDVRVCGWSDGPAPWPMGRVGHGGRGAYIITDALARAVRAESAAAISHWLGVSIGTVSKWRRALGVPPFNEGTRRLYSLWKPAKLPDEAVPFSPAALRGMRLARGWTQRQTAERMGWTSVNSYGQMESGRRRRSTLRTIERLAAVFGCSVNELLDEANAKPGTAS
jgi:DNA-binding Xre family transcriptional regulator